MIASVTTPALLAAAVPPQATLNAALNALAGVLLVIGYVLIRRRRETAHKWTMLAAFVVSVLFLTSYLTYHYQSNWTETKFQGPLPLRNWLYYPLLVSHVILAAMVPVLALRTIYLGLRDRREAHRRLARWTFPIWLYVSVTGVLVYLMLYYLYPQP